MSAFAFIWTPRGDSTERTCLLETKGLPTKFQGMPVTDRASRITKGGRIYAVTYDQWHEVELEVRRLGPTLDRTSFARLWAWWEHAAAGGEFKFTRDTAKTSSTTTTSALAQGATSIPVASATGLATNDWIFLEDADDPTRFERLKISNGGASPLTVYDGTARSYVNTSIVRHAEYFPKCIALDPGDPPATEREAGQGNEHWNLRLKFRTVR